MQQHICYIHFFFAQRNKLTIVSSWCIVMQRHMWFVFSSMYKGKSSFSEAMRCNKHLSCVIPSLHNGFRYCNAGHVLYISSMHNGWVSSFNATPSVISLQCMRNKLSSWLQCRESVHNLNVAMQHQICYNTLFYAQRTKLTIVCMHFSSVQKVKNSFM